MERLSLMGLFRRYIFMSVHLTSFAIMSHDFATHNWAGRGKNDGGVNKWNN